ncbi:MAG: DMT family transporter [Bacteroidota bacterium]
MDERNKGLMAVVFAALVWSSAGLFIKWLPQEPFTILCVRALYTMLVFFAVYRKEVLRINRLTILNVLFYAALLICFVTSTKWTTAANAIFLQYTGVAYVLLLEPLLLKVPYRRVNIITTVVCFVGMSLFFMEGLDTSGGWGLVIAVLSGIAYAGFMLGQRGNPPEYHVAAVFWGNVLVALIGLPTFLASAPFTAEAHWMLAYLGLIQMGLGYLLFTYGLKRTTATETSLITMLEPLFNPVWVVIGYGERPSTLAIIGGLIIVLALVVRILVLRKRVPQRRVERLP